MQVPTLLTNEVVLALPATHVVVVLDTAEFGTPVCPDGQVGVKGVSTLLGVQVVLHVPLFTIETVDFGEPVGLGQYHEVLLIPEF